MRQGAIKVKIQTVGREINYGTANVHHKMRLLTVKDDSGNEFKAMALGNVANGLNEGEQIFITKPKPLKNCFVLKTE